MPTRRGGGLCSLTRRTSAVPAATPTKRPAASPASGTPPANRLNTANMAAAGAMSLNTPNGIDRAERGNRLLIAGCQQEAIHAADRARGTDGDAQRIPGRLTTVANMPATT